MMNESEGEDFDGANPSHLNRSHAQEQASPLSSETLLF